MIERVCPSCSAGNPGDQPYCGQCGSPFEQRLTHTRTTPLARRSIHVPARWQQASKVVALGIASLAAEVGIAWLQRRHQPIVPATPQPQQSARVVALGRRVTQRWQNGQLQERIEEQVVWFASDGPK